MLQWCESHVSEATGIAGLLITCFFTLVGAIVWASKVYAEVHAMRLGIEAMGEFKATVNKDSELQWTDLSVHDRRLGGMEVGLAGIAGQVQIHDREIRLLMEKKNG